MDRETVWRLDRINRDFYATHAEEFLATRASPWPGWDRLLPYLRGIEPPSAPLRILDLGCGNGRLGTWLEDRLERRHGYVGLDRSLALLSRVRPTSKAALPARFLVDVVRSDGHIPCRTATYDAALALAFLHHVPSLELRSALIDDLLRVVRPGGVLALSFWQFAHEERFERRIVPWQRLGRYPAAVIEPAQLEEGDHLLAWGDRDLDPPVVRYCHYTSPEAAERLVTDRPATVLDTFHADGRGGRLNLYLVLQRS
ncbi:MAG TPA: class I SAM-dependent methyltransferase [Thermoanaerobaculia bacterium]|nr:class I SAM-dependent methyltransferase [Thermoanaerobaculia bacterium]